MKRFNLDGHMVDVYECTDFPYEVLGECVDMCSSGRREYNELLTAFDIETTTILGDGDPLKPFDGRTFGFMYCWAYAVGDRMVCRGRTWAEFTNFLGKLLDNVHGKLVTYCHNLAFEFQFMRNFLPKPEKVFARVRREPVYVDYSDVEFRCSYILTNMSLNTFLKNTPGVTVFKGSGEEFDYTEKRYPDTPLTDKQWEYQIRDVVGLVQGIRGLLESNGDTLATVPYTSTGFVRRDYLEKCKGDMENIRRVKRCALDKAAYKLVEDAKRGGVAGSNKLWSDTPVDVPVYSMDKKSSYPEQMMCKYYPASRFLFRDIRAGSDEWFRALGTKCCVMVLEFTNIRVRGVGTIPYLSKAKCVVRGEHKFGNGKVYHAESLFCTVTEVDLRVIDSQYSYSDLKVHRMMVASRGMLSKAFREHLSEMFQIKTELETGDKLLYAKYKNKINASYGMMLTAILHPEIEYRVGADDVWFQGEVKESDIDYLLRKHYRDGKTFLNYQDGVYVTAHAREDLYEGIRIVNDDLVCSDTDSVKFVGEEHISELEQINERIRRRAEGLDVKPYAEVDGKRTFLGVWELDAVYHDFVTLGAKKYAYTLEDEAEVVQANGELRRPLHVTVSGLGKSSGAGYLDYMGGIERFKDGTRIPAFYWKKTEELSDEERRVKKCVDGRYRCNGSGRTAGVYNDVEGTFPIEVDGHRITVGSNIGIYNVDYTIGVTGEWMALLDGYSEEDIGMCRTDGERDWREADYKYR